MLKRFILIGTVLAGLMAGSPASAHESHEELGAGPGPAVEEVATSNAVAEKAKAECPVSKALGAINVTLDARLG